RIKETIAMTMRTPAATQPITIPTMTPVLSFILSIGYETHDVLELDPTEA
ncbi:unnamed protein product, partial [Rotaria magnacalcarata]